MRYAIVKDDVVINIAESDSALESNWIKSDTAKINDTYNGSSFTTPSKSDTELVQEQREYRNLLLQETDFYALSDVTMSNDMKTYRQALRDLPDHSNWPNLGKDDWPTKP
jgi:hypothetical protein